MATGAPYVHAGHPLLHQDNRYGVDEAKLRLWQMRSMMSGATALQKEKGLSSAELRVAAPRSRTEMAAGAGVRVFFVKTRRSPWTGIEPARNLGG